VSAARETARLTGIAVGTAALVVGAGIATGYIVDVRAERDHLRSEVQAARPTAAPTPRVTVTVTPRPAPTQVARPPAPAATATIQPVIAFAHDPSSSGRGGGGSSSTAPPSGPGSPPARCSSGQLVTVRIPLLPCNAVQIGGSR
jgi:hypothetical protein